MPDLRDESWDAFEEAPPRPVNGHKVSVDPVQAQWARFRDQFAEIANDGYWTFDDLEAKILSHRAFFFPGKSAAMVCEIVAYPSGCKMFQATWAVGDLGELLAMEPGVAAMGRMLGCDGLVVEGRAGWSKALKALGYELRTVTMYKAT